MADAKPSKLLSYASALYARMDLEATQDNTDRVWRGRLIVTCRELGIPDGSRGKVVSKLRSMGCVEQVMRGYRGNALTVFILHHPPTTERFEEPEDGYLTSGPSLDTIAHALEDMRRQLGGVNLVSALANIEQRLLKLEKEVGIRTA